MNFIKHHSPSSLNLFCASPAMWVLEKVIGVRQSVGAPAHRGTGVEEGVTLGLLNPDAPMQACVDVALKKYDTISALSGDARRQDYRETIPAMVERALAELRPYGIPSRTQGFVEWKPDGLELPIVGYFDYHWDSHNITVDLKTSEKLASSVKISHARQVSLYVTSNNADARISYVTPKKAATYQVENIDAHRSALHQIALRVEKMLSLSDDPQFFKSIIAPDLESYFWGGPNRQIAFEHWGI
jgi:hypothetical protein